MTLEPLLPLGERLRAAFEDAVRRRVVFFAGLPGVGKSLLLKQLVLLARGAGRTVYLLQWDVTRAAFETPELLARYPEVAGVTHPAIRKAVGLWVRSRVAAWGLEHAGAESGAMLIGEVPLIGNRLVELAQVHEDAAEPLLASGRTLFFIPLPSREVRARIETARAHSIADPQHPRERADAPPDVLRLLWREVFALAARLGVGPAGVAYRDEPAYDPDLYAGVFLQLLRRRHAQLLPIDTLLPATTSVYDFGGVRAGTIHELFATPEEVAAAMTALERAYTPERLEREVAAWYEVERGGARAASAGRRSEDRFRR